MVRAGSTAPSTGRAPSVNKIRKNRDKPYKIQFESVMTKKKKLKLHDIHGSARPLPGYTFLPVGFSDLAEECKELSRHKEADVAVVSAGSRSAAQDPSKLSHHVHRVGYHFRTDVFDEACNKLGYCTRNGKLEKIEGASRLDKAMFRYGSRFDLIDINNHSEEESQKVKKFIRELFPKIPEADLEAIYKRAWEQGAKTVGNAEDLSLSRQVQLATIARIRHTYTDYDRLLRVGSWKDARTAVEHRCLAKLIEWRGEHDHDHEELEEILRETIVIDDDDDDDEVEQVQSGEDDSDTSLEIVQHTIAPRDLRVEPDETAVSRGAASFDKRAQKIQARWQNARSLRYGNKPDVFDNSLPDRVTVALDRQGKAPRTFETGGIEYIRISPDAEPRPQTYPHGLVPAIPGSNMDGPNHASNMHGAPTHHLHTQPYKNVNYYNPPPAVTLPGLAYPAVQSIEKPHDSQASWHVSNARPHVIDLTTPPKPTSRYNNPPPLREHAPIRYPTVRTQGPEADNDVNFVQARPRSLVPSGAPIQARPLPSRHHSGIEVLDLTKTHAYPVPSRERPISTDQNEIQRLRPNAYDSMYPQPVYGQPAYPQMRPYLAAAPKTPPRAFRPIHGAPAAVQPVFGAPSPQRYMFKPQDTRYRLLEK